MRSIFFILIFFSIEARAELSKINNEENNCSVYSDSNPKKLIVITDQALNRIIIVNAITKEITWEWKPAEIENLTGNENWFEAPSDAKPVMNATCLLITASKGGVALVRIRDKKILFYAFAGGNTHSAAMLPDGNIVSASSTGNYLTIFQTDTLHFPGGVYQKKIFLPFAHNVVWDKKRQVLWTAGRNKIYSFKYNFNCNKPDLIPLDSILIPGTDAHDLYPVYGKELLWLTTPENVFIFNPANHNLIEIKGENIKNIKDVSSGPKSYSTIMMVPKEKWWTDEVNDEHGNIIYKKVGLKIYKARWLLPDSFSENEGNVFMHCH